MYELNRTLQIMLYNSTPLEQQMFYRILKAQRSHLSSFNKIKTKHIDKDSS